LEYRLIYYHQISCSIQSFLYTRCFTVS